jgi:hypothetical protein
VLGRTQRADWHVLVRRLPHASGGSLLLALPSLNGMACGILVAHQWITIDRGANITTSTRTEKMCTLTIGATAYTAVDPTRVTMPLRMDVSGSLLRHALRSSTTKALITLGARPPSTTHLGARTQTHILGLGAIARMAASTARTARPTHPVLATRRRLSKS